MALMSVEDKSGVNCIHNNKNYNNAHHLLGFVISRLNCSFCPSPHTAIHYDEWKKNCEEGGDENDANDEQGKFCESGNAKHPKYSI